MTARHAIAALTAAAAIATSTLPAFAQTSPAPPSRVPTQSTTTLSTSVTTTQPTTTAATYRNSDPLRGLYNQKPMINQCADQPVIGPMPVPAPGSAQAQPGYEFMQDFDAVGVGCRKAM